ncbi:MAG: FAD-dependent oxidoreductase, partial [Beijerinckiaceae bacterium]
MHLAHNDRQTFYFDHFKTGASLVISTFLGASRRISMTRPAPTTTRFDVAVVGGGINGTSAARELSAAGYHVLLVEKSDLANGASSRSSRILHCGLRYFETRHPMRTFARSPSRFLGAVRMAKAAMESREELARLRPERCKPFTMCFPLYANDDIRGWHLDLGLALLHRLAPSGPPLDYRRIRRGLDQTLPFASDLRDRGQLKSIATYREYMIDWPDRICVDYALEAERNGAALRLFTKATLRERNADGEWVIDLTEQDGSTDQATAAVVLNLAGTWIDGVAPAGRASNRPLVRGTKGAHIVVRLPERYKGFGLATLHRGGMPFYCLPLEDDWYYFGPTETPFDDDADSARTTGDDIDFLLGEANHLLPGLSLQRNDVAFTWAGVRPLTFDQDQPMGRRTREIHDLTDRGLPGVLAMTAGPVQSHMSAARELREAVGKMLPPSRMAPVMPPAPSASSPAPSGSKPDERENYRKAVREEHARDLRGILYTRT